MNPYLKRLLLVAALSLAASLVAYVLVVKCCKQYFNSFKKNEEVFRQQRHHDVLLLGSSRMKNTVNPKVLDSVLGVNSYNAGTDAATMLEMEMILNSYLSLHPKPSLVVLSLDYFSLDTKRKLGFYPIYLPYDDVHEVQKTLKRAGLQTGFYKLFPFLKLTELDDYYKGAVLKVAMKKDEIPAGDYIYKGYVSNTLDTIPRSFQGSRKIEEMSVTEEAKNALVNIIHICKKNGIKLVFTYAPEYKFMNQKTVKNFSAIMGFYDSVANSYRLPFLRHDSLPICSQGKYFANPGHVNRKGADVYTAILANHLIGLNVMDKKRLTIK